MDVTVDDGGGGTQVGGVLLEVEMEYRVVVELDRMEVKRVAVLLCETDRYEVDDEVLVLKRKLLLSLVKSTLTRWSKYVRVK